MESIFIDSNVWNLLFEQKINLLLMEQQGEPIASYVEELEEIVDSTSDIGWGYHDALGDMFYKVFGGAK